MTVLCTKHVPRAKQFKINVILILIENQQPRV